MTAEAAVTAAPVPLTRTLLSLLRGFRGAPGLINLTARSLHGVAEPEQLQLQTTVEHLPGQLLTWLEDRWGVRIGPAARERDGTPVTLPYAFTTWGPALDFSRETGWQYRPRPADLEAIAAALRGFERAPTFVIDGLREVVALWALAAPVDLRRDSARVVALQRALATRLGADVAAGEDLRALIPVPGSIVRNLGADPPLVTAAVAAPERRYSIDQLERALAAPMTTKGGRK